ncbi:MAG: transposase family protein [Gemmatimonadetes bacterium]|nr:transposase family protein [Gemmatimonadota bacterium]MYH51350.1 transposase family protein [Gemmatimonadota bacterium]MYK66059.1 transposase family protein [Gemmatimonadota bacterium]
MKTLDPDSHDDGSPQTQSSLPARTLATRRVSDVLIKQAALPWARRRQRLTLAFEEVVVSLVQEMPIRAVSRRGCGGW